MIDVSPEVEVFLEESSARCGRSIDQLLRQVLHEQSMRMTELFFPDAPDGIKRLVDQLDRALRIRNPGLQYVQRSTYVGFRREEIPVRVKDGRTQVFATLRIGHRPDRLLVVLPISGTSVEAAAQAGVRLKDFRRETGRHQGHHGIGDVELDLRSSDEVNSALEAFAEWLASEAQQPVR